jgi:transcription termination/antitermination protein NusG
MPWYAVHTRSRHEVKAYTGLLQKSIEAFLPRIEVWSKRLDRRKKILVPMFPGYLFVNHPALDNATKITILKTFGVVRLLGNPGGGEPVPVPDRKIDDIQRLVHSKMEMHHFHYPQIGQPAMIIDGPLKGIEGVVLSGDYKREIFVISVELLQRAVAVKLEGFQIARR